MSKIDNLIKELCPNGVEFKELGEVWNKAPKSKLGVGKIKELKDGNIICFTSGNQNYFVNEFLVDGEFIFINDGGTADTKYNNGKAYYTDHVFTFTIKKDFSDSLLVKFVYYFLRGNQEYINTKLFQGSGLKNLNKRSFEKLEIPIPPLPVQEEIVKVLDTFTKLEAELEAELTARQQQYSHYRDELLNFDGKDVNYIPLGDIYKFQYGTGNTIPQTGGEYPVYGSNGIVGSHSEYNSEDAPVIGHIGAYAGIVNWGKGKHYVTYNGVICKLISKDVIPQYAYYLLLLQDFRSMAKNESQPFVSYDALKAPNVPIPSLEEQARIVAILDKFDSLVNDISVGLPAEITSRHQQYEHYRNKLLTFKEAC